MSERALQTVKILMEKTEYPYLSMLEYRTTPVFWIVSSRIVDEQDIIIYRSNNQRHTNNKETTAQRIQHFQKQKLASITEKYNHNPKVKDLSKLSMGDEVYIKYLDRPDKVIGLDDIDRSYLVKGECGNTIMKNRSALIETNGSTEVCGLITKCNFRD